MAENNYNSLTDKCREEVRVLAAGHRGVEVRADVDAELGGDRGGCRLARRAGDDSGRAVAVGYLPRRPQQRIGYAGCVVELVKGWWR